MKNLKVSMKLLVGFMTILLLAVMVAVVGSIGMNSINKADDVLYNENLVAISSMGIIRELYQDQRVQTRNMIIHAGNSEKLTQYNNELIALDKQIRDYFAVYDNTISDPSAEKAYHNARKIYENDYQDIKTKVYEACLESPEAAREILYSPSVVEVTNAIMFGFDESMANNDQWAKETLDRNTKLFKDMLTLEIIILVIAVAVALFLTSYISGFISKPLVLLSSFMQKAGSEGDIALRPEDIENIGNFAQNKDEIGQAIKGTAEFVQHVINVAQDLETIASGDLTNDIKMLSDRDVMAASMKNTVESLNNIFGKMNNISSHVSSSSKQVAESSTSIATSASQMAEGAQSLAEGAMKQTEYMGELTNSIDDIAEKTRENVEMTGKAANLADTIISKAEKGSQHMDEMIKAVNDINEASNSVSKIMETISGIAEQTNLLALNAAIEAARAGEHGRGFAVVAEEVRKLAAESEEAVKETSSIIRASIDKAELGARVASEMAASLTEIVDGINESSRLNMEISHASEEQSEGIAQINLKVSQVADIIQNNSAVAEENAATSEESAAAAQESAAASEEMSSQAEELEKLIAQFKLKQYH